MRPIPEGKCDECKNVKPVISYQIENRQVWLCKECLSQGVTLLESRQFLNSCGMKLSELKRGTNA